MQVLEAWLIYLLVVAIVWVILYAVSSFSGITSGAKLFIALVIGAIVLIFSIGSVTTSCGDDRFWYGLLVIIAFIAPILIGLWLLFNGGWDCMQRMTGIGESRVDQTFVCQGNDCYPVETKIKNRGGKTTIYYQDGDM